MKNTIGSNVVDSDERALLDTKSEEESSERNAESNSAKGEVFCENDTSATNDNDSAVLTSQHKCSISSDQTGEPNHHNKNQQAARSKLFFLPHSTRTATKRFLNMPPSFAY